MSYNISRDTITVDGVEYDIQRTPDRGAPEEALTVTQFSIETDEFEPMLRGSGGHSWLRGVRGGLDVSARLVATLARWLSVTTATTSVTRRSTRSTSRLTVTLVMVPVKPTARTIWSVVIWSVRLAARTAMVSAWLTFIRSSTSEGARCPRRHRTDGLRALRHHDVAPVM